MNLPMTDTLSHWFATLDGDDDLALASVIDELDGEDVCHTVLLRRRGGQWSAASLEERSIGIHVRPDGRLVVPCYEGSVFDTEGGDADAAGSRVGSGPRMPGTLRHLTCSRVIGNRLFVAGMQRQVFSRPLAGGDWSREDDGTLVPPTSTDIAGFNGIDGLDTGDLYAVGLHGALWRRHQGQWIALDGPSNTSLVAVAAVTPRRVYIAGARGLLWVGHGEVWHPIDHGATDQTLSSLAWFAGHLYAVAERGVLFRLDGHSLTPVRLPGHLSVHAVMAAPDGGRLLALGARGAAVLREGAAWETVALPAFGG